MRGKGRVQRNCLGSVGCRFDMPRGFGRGQIDERVANLRFGSGEALFCFILMSIQVAVLIHLDH